MVQLFLAGGHVRPVRGDRADRLCRISSDDRRAAAAGRKDRRSRPASAAGGRAGSLSSRSLIAMGWAAGFFVSAPFHPARHRERILRDAGVRDTLLPDAPTSQFFGGSPLKKYLLLASAMAVLAVPATGFGQQSTAPAAAGTTAADAGATRYGTWGFDLTGMDKSVKPGDDWYRFVNGAWTDR